METKLFKGLVVIATGTIAVKVIKEVKRRKAEKEMYEAVYDEMSEKE